MRVTQTAKADPRVSPSLEEDSLAAGKPIEIGAITVDPVSVHDASRLIRLRASERKGSSVHLVNAYTVALAEHDESYAECVNDGWLNLADGRPLQWLSRFRGDEQRLEQIRGIDLFHRVLADGRDENLKHFFLGSTEEARERMASKLQERYGSIEIAGSESPPFRDLTSDEQSDQAKRIRESGAQVIWVGLGTPKQDAEIERLASEVDAVCIGVGAAFALAAGDQWYVPEWVSILGLEWLSRLVQEPKRLWRRYLGGNLIFLGVVIKDLTSRGSRTR